MEGGLTPLLISRSLSRVGTAVLYAHPHLAYNSIDRFIDNVRKPCSYMMLDTKVSLVRHLTVRPTPMLPQLHQSSMGRDFKSYVNVSFHDLMRLFPTLHSFTLKDCLITNRQDAIVVFGALPMTVPKKARLEIRMMEPPEVQYGRDPAATTRPDTVPLPRLAGYRSLRDQGIVGQWRDAFFDDTQVQLPQDWLDPDYRETELPRANQPPPPTTDVLSRAIALCEVVLRTNYTPLSIPDRNLMRTTIITHGNGPYGPDMARQHAAAVLSELRGIPLEKPPQSVVEQIDMLAIIWTTHFRAHGHLSPLALRTPLRLRSGGRRFGPHTQSEHNLGEIRRRNLAKLPRASDDSNIVMTIIPGSESDPIYVGDSESDSEADTEAAMLEEAVRQSRIQDLPSFGEGQASSPTSHGTASATNDLVPEDIKPVIPNQADDSSSSIAAATAPSEQILGLSPMPAWPHTEQPLMDVIDQDQLSGQVPIAPTTSTETAGHVSPSTGTGGARGAIVAGIAADIRALIAGAEAQQGGGTGHSDSDSDSDSSEINATLPAPPAAYTANIPMADSNADPGSSANPAQTAVYPPANITAELYATVGYTSNRSARLAAAMRDQMLHLIENTWSPELQAFSLVALDPLSSVIAQSPTLQLWVKIPVPHIRVHLPRGINSLAVFKGTKENIRDRQRDLRLARRSEQSDDEGDAVLSTTASGVHHRVLRSRYPQAPIVDPIVGGDGSGGGLVHPDTKLFEIEVNTVREMTDDLWLRAGSELPPQVCRILTGEQDWSDVVLGMCLFLYHGCVNVLTIQARSVTLDIKKLDSNPPKPTITPRLPYQGPTTCSTRTTRVWMTLS